jgi:hypothetical protein
LRRRYGVPEKVIYTCGGLTDGRLLLNIEGRGDGVRKGSRYCRELGGGGGCRGRGGEL